MGSGKEGEVEEKSGEMDEEVKEKEERERDREDLERGVGKREQVEGNEKVGRLVSLCGTVLPKAEINVLQHLATWSA